MIACRSTGDMASAYKPYFHALSPGLSLGVRSTDPDGVDPGAAEGDGSGRAARYLLYSAAWMPFPAPCAFAGSSLGLSSRARASAAPGRAHLTSTASSITVMSVLHFAEGLMASSAGGITKLLLRGSHMPSPRV